MSAEAGSDAPPPPLRQLKAQQKRKYKPRTTPRPLSSAAFAPLRIQVPHTTTDLIAAFDAINKGTYFLNADCARSTAPLRRVVQDTIREYHPAYVIPISVVSRDDQSSLESNLRRVEDIREFCAAQAAATSEEKADALLASLVRFGTRRIHTRKRKFGRFSSWLRKSDAEPTSSLLPTPPPLIPS